MKENNTYHEGAEANNLPESLRVNPFDVPKNYFNDLESSLLSQVKLISLKDSEVFEVPAQYFDSLSTSIEGKITEESLRSKVQSDGFEVPASYFNELEENIFSKIAENQLKEEVTSDGFEVPLHYFDNLTEKIISSSKAGFSEKEVPVRTIGMKSRIFRRYAVAASIALALSFGTYWGYNNYLRSSENHALSASTEVHLSGVPEEEIINYLAASNTGDDMIYLSKYTDENDLPTNGIAYNIAEEEIEEYLNYSL